MQTWRRTSFVLRLFSRWRLRYFCGKIPKECRFASSVKLCVWELLQSHVARSKSSSDFSLFCCSSVCCFPISNPQCLKKAQIYASTVDFLISLYCSSWLPNPRLCLMYYPYIWVQGKHLQKICRCFKNGFNRSKTLFYLFRDVSLRGSLSFLGTPPWLHSHCYTHPHLKASLYSHSLICSTGVVGPHSRAPQWW